MRHLARSKAIPLGFALLAAAALMAAALVTGSQSPPAFALTTTPTFTSTPLPTNTPTVTPTPCPGPCPTATPTVTPTPTPIAASTVFPMPVICCGIANTLTSPALQFTVSITTTAPLSYKYDVPASACGPLRVRVYVEDTEVDLTGYLGYQGDPQGRPLTTGIRNIGPVATGQHYVTLVPEGLAGGCITTTLTQWSGTLTVYTGVAAPTPTPTPDCSQQFSPPVANCPTWTPTPTPDFSTYTPTPTNTPCAGACPPTATPDCNGPPVSPPVAGCPTFTPTATFPPACNTSPPQAGCADTDGDFWADNGDNCPTVANNDQNNTDAANTNANRPGADTFGDPCDGDIDGDGYTNTQETSLITGPENPTLYCNIMRADLDGDRAVSILDLTLAANKFTQTIPPAPDRYRQDADFSISILDLTRMANVFTQNVSACP